MERKRKIYLLIIGIMIGVIALLGTSYALWIMNFTQQETNVLQLDCFNITFNETTESHIQLTNTFPLTDQQGEELTPYHFTVTNKCKSYASYQVRIEVKKDSNLDDKYLKVKLDEKKPTILDSNSVTNGLLASDTKKGYILDTGYLESEETKEYDLRLWLDESVTLDSKNSDNTNVQKSKWGGLITISSSYMDIYEEDILNGATPVLAHEKLVPIIYETKETGPVVKKADITSEWYSYEKQEWANAVITGNSYELLGSNVHGATKQEDSVHLDGVADDYIDLGLANYDFQNSMTYVLHTKIFETVSYHLLSNHEGAGAAIRIGGGKLSFSVYDSNITNYQEISVENVAEKIGTDLTIIAIVDNATLKLGINNQWFEKTFASAIKIKPSSEPILIGGNPHHGIPENNYAKMDVYQVAIFDRAITDEEIEDISNNNFKITNGEGLLKYVDFTNKTYEPGEVISEDNIESYFVWIPRYEYQIWNGEEETSQFNNVKDLGVIEDATKKDELNKAQEIQIKFVTKEDTLKQGTHQGEWLTHPAFTSFNSNGFWVGKFETGYKGATNKDEAQQTEKDTSKVIIKPNAYSWRNINVSNAFYTTYDYQRDLDSHMMKNMEWGAVAYLTNSKYGRCPNGTCTEVRVNNNSDFITGSSAVHPPTCGYTDSNEECNKYGTDTEIVNSYSNSLSVASSTTNNYYGLYDMSGGSWEYVMGVMQAKADEATPASGRNQTYNSGFEGPYSCPNCDSQSATENTNGQPWPDSIYYDLYDYDATSYSFNRGKLGDGTKEFGPFYSVAFQKPSDGTGPTRYVGSYNGDDAFFASSESPWFMRGGPYTNGTETGVEAFSYTNGHAGFFTSFRIVLTP